MFTLALLAPTLVSAAIEGRLPRGIGVANLRDAPLEWSRQLTMLGLSSELPVEEPDRSWCRPPGNKGRMQIIERLG